MPDTLDILGRARVVAILRGDFREDAEDVAGALLAAGLRALEVSLTSADALAVIARLVRFAEGRGAVVGAGTVMTVEEADRVAGAGARFVISPHVDASVVGATRRLGLVSIPGAFTPTEIATAKLAGADAVKLFPAAWVGPEGLPHVLAPFPGLRLVPTGGVDLDRARQYLARGAWAVGVCSPLMGGDARALEQRARGFASLAEA